MSEEAYERLPALAQAIVKTDREYEKLMDRPVVYFSAIPAMKKVFEERHKLIAAAHATYGKSAASPSGAKA
jgi:hypothetical protein